MLRGKKIILGVTGSIAAYKSAVLVRELVRAGSEVKVIMTESARGFITPLTLSTLSNNPVLYRFTDDENSGDWNNHVELGIWADAMLIAPCSAHTLGKMVHGICDNLLLATYLSAKCPVYVAPAMDLDMYAHQSTSENLQKLLARNVKIIYPQEGELASGLRGKGRMTEPEDIREYLSKEFSRGIDLKGKKVMITAGPTYEDIDPVRFLGNRSTGKMGYALAQVCADLGADVQLISGPVSLRLFHDNVEIIEVRSANQMFNACQGLFLSMDIVIMAAAVADYSPKIRSESKIKKGEGDLSIELGRTKDILASLGEKKKNGQILVGFALETDSPLENAKAKLRKKNLDMIVLNSLRDEGAGFGHDTNRITIIDRHNKQQEFELKSKADVAFDIVRMIYDRIDE